MRWCIMMKRILSSVGAAMLLVVSPVSAQDTERARVVAQCGNWYLLDAGGGFVLVEQMWGPRLRRGDELAGNFRSFGGQTVLSLPYGDEVQLYVQDYGLSSGRSQERMSERC